ncbi:MAG: transporter ATP-binding protein [Cohnella sp.]|nr:transporter ATP-binding protein [Cohnella sp.]
MIVSGQHIKKYHGAQLVLDDVTFEIPQGGRVGLIGRNGSGKTTLLRLVAGLERPDEGDLAIRKETKIGYLTQIPQVGDDVTVYEVLAKSFRDVRRLRNKMTELEASMSDPAAPSDQDQLAGLLKQYADAQERFERDGGYEMDARISQVANGLRIDAAQLDRPYAVLSGGEKTKAALASLLIERPALLLLDEPTNHLDLGSVEWLETYLRDYEGSCLIVSHDRYFLDRVVGQIIELEDGESSVYHTSYTEYVVEKEERLLRQFAEFQEQQKKIAQMKEAIKQLESWGKIGGSGKFFKRAQSMRKALDRMEKVKRPVLDRRSAEFHMNPADRSGRDVVIFKGITKSYGARKILDGADGALYYGDKVALVGDNGSGKSTLAKVLIGMTEPDAGKMTLGARVELGYLGQEDEPEHNVKSVLAFFREEAGVEEGEARSLLARQLFYGPDVFKSVALLSGGEWTRLRLALLLHRKPNLLLLDEPTNHLDIASREALEESLDDFPGTVLAISHDRYFINRFAQRVWGIRNGKLTDYIGNFDRYREKSAQQRMPEEARKPEGTSSRKREPEARPHPASKPAAPAEPLRLEKAIAETEASLAHLDAQLDQLQSDTAELNRLSECWEERERLEQRLQLLYEEWMALF